MMKNSPRWGFIDIILVYLGIMIASIVFVAWQQEIGQILLGWGIPQNYYTFFVSAFLVQFLITLILVYVFTVGIHRVSLRDIGFRMVPAHQILKYGVGGGILLLAIVLLMSIPISYLNPQLEPQSYEEILRSLTRESSVFWLAFIGVVLAPLSEEIFYRGMIYPVFRRYFGPSVGMAAAGIIFGLAHFDLWRAVPLAVGGIGLCYIYEKTRSIWVTTVAHGVWNLIMTLMVYYSINFLT